jgi:hypothetical protein
VPKENKPIKQLAEIILGVGVKVDKLLKAASNLESPILYMSLLKASNAMKVAEYVAANSKDGDKQPLNLDKSALILQFKDYLEGLPDV